MGAAIDNPRTHFIIVSLGTAGDMYPFLNIARALTERGHQVTFLGPQLYEHLVLQAGLAFHPLIAREQSLASLNDPDFWHPLKCIDVLWRSISSALPRIPEFVAGLPKSQSCVLVAHPLALPAAALAQSVRPDMRIVAAYLAPSNLRSCHDPMMVGPLRIPSWVPMVLRRWLWWVTDTQRFDPIALPDLNSARQAHGLKPVEHVIEHAQSVPNHSITLFPSWFAKLQPDWPQPLSGGDFQLYDPHPEKPFSPALSQFLAAGNAPIVFTPGTGYRHAYKYFVSALQAIQRLGRRAIFLTSHYDHVPKNLPVTVLWQEYLPLRALLPHMSVLVHHGGIGTIAEALRAGVRQLVVPCAYDQFDNARRVQAMGVGSVLPMTRFRTGTLYRALKSLLSSDTVPIQCQTVAMRFAKSTDVHALCSAIESVQYEGRTGKATISATHNIELTNQLRRQSTTPSRLMPALLPADADADADADVNAAAAAATDSI